MVFSRISKTADGSLQNMSIGFSFPIRKILTAYLKLAFCGNYSISKEEGNYDWFMRPKLRKVLLKKSICMPRDILGNLSTILSDGSPVAILLVFAQK